MKVVFVPVVVLVAFVACMSACSSGGPGGGVAPGASAAPRVDAPEPAEQACSRDVECTLVEDCCGCAAGGMQTAIRTDAVEAVTERSEDVCAERSCGGAASNHRSCSATAARCLGGRCVPAL